MRLTKKLLTALLPIAAAGTLAPVLSSCNKGNGYSINYGDDVDCLNEKSTSYHSINDVKNSVKSHTAPESSPTIRSSELPLFRDGNIVQQMMYYDLIASNSICDEKQQVKFALSGWKVTDNELTLKFSTKDGELVDGEATLAYASNTTTSTQIDLVISSSTNEVYRVKSYNFQNTQLKD